MQSPEEYTAIMTRDYQTLAVTRQLGGRCHLTTGRRRHQIACNQVENGHITISTARNEDRPSSIQCHIREILAPLCLDLLGSLLKHTCLIRHISHGDEPVMARHHTTSKHVHGHYFVVLETLLVVQGNLHVAIDVPVNDCFVRPTRDDLQTFVWVFLSSVKGEFQRDDTRRMVFQMVDVLIIVLTLEYMDQPISRS